MTTSAPPGQAVAVSDESLATRTRRRTFWNFFLVIGGRVALVGSWFLATMLMARRMGPEAFGIYAVCQNAIKIVTGCVGDPLAMAVMREAPLFLKSDRPRAVDLIRSAFWMRVALGMVAVMVAIAIPNLISWIVFARWDYALLAILTGVGILGDLLLRSALGYFQVSEKFGRFMATDAVWQLGRTAAVLALVLAHEMSARAGIVLYVTAPYVAFLIALAMLPADMRRLAPPHRRHVSEILQYSKWMVAAMMMAAIYERLDIILLGHFRGARELGIYAGAMALAVIPDFLDGAIQTVLAPRVAPAYARGKFRELQQSYLRYSIPLGLLAAGSAMYLGGLAIRIFLSAQYSESIPAFRLLVLSTIFNIVFTPLPSALLNFVAPRVVMLCTTIGLTFVAVGGLLVIPRFGVMGAAVLILSVRVLIGTLTIVLARRISRVLPPPTDIMNAPEAIAS